MLKLKTKTRPIGSNWPGLFYFYRFNIPILPFAFSGQYAITQRGLQNY